MTSYFRLSSFYSIGRRLPCPIAMTPTISVHTVLTSRRGVHLLHERGGSSAVLYFKGCGSYGSGPLYLGGQGGNSFLWLDWRRGEHSLAVMDASALFVRAHYRHGRHARMQMANFNRGGGV